jgi:hypothetical protein
MGGRWVQETAAQAGCLLVVLDSIEKIENNIQWYGHIKSRASITASATFGHSA